MQPQQSAQLLLSQMSALEEAIGERISQNIPVKILLQMFVEEENTNAPVRCELSREIDAPVSLFERYVKVLASEGLIEICQEDASQPTEFRLSAPLKKRLEAIFDVQS